MTLTAFNRRRREIAAQQAEAEREEAEKPTPVVTETAPAEKPLTRMNKAELLAVATERGVEVSDTDTKADIIALLEEPAENEQE